MGATKNARARRKHARGEGAPARKAPENRFPPSTQLLGSAAWSVKFFDRKLISLRALKRKFAGNSTCRSIPAVNCKQNQIADQNKKRKILIFSVVYAKKFANSLRAFGYKEIWIFVLHESIQAVREGKWLWSSDSSKSPLDRDICWENWRNVTGCLLSVWKKAFRIMWHV